MKWSNAKIIKCGDFSPQPLESGINGFFSFKKPTCNGESRAWEVYLYVCSD